MAEVRYVFTFIEQLIKADLKLDLSKVQFSLIYYLLEQDRLVAGVGDQVVVGGALLEAVDVEHLVEHLPWVDKIPEALVAANRYK